MEIALRLNQICNWKGVHIPLISGSGRQRRRAAQKLHGICFD